VVLVVPAMLVDVWGATVVVVATATVVVVALALLAAPLLEPLPPVPVIVVVVTNLGLVESSHAMPSLSASSLCGSGGSAVKFTRPPMTGSPQSMSGGGGGMQKSG
jgi:hypothetical protein